MKKVWFNRWFSTGIEFIDFIKAGDIKNEYFIYVTHHHKRKSFIKCADHFSIEPSTRGKQYIDFCLDYCKKNQIDIFIPKYCLNDISEFREEFEKIGVKILIAGSKNLINLVRDKAAFSEECYKNGLCDIPHYYLVNKKEEFKLAYEKIKSKNEMVCCKPSISEGGLDFRLIYETKKEKLKYKKIEERLISYKTFLKKLKSEFHNIMVMEYLDGLEYSIDCLAYNGELLVAIPRKKIGWHRIVENKNELIEIAKKITKHFNFSYVFNIQVKYSGKIPKLLEVNPRMSAGLGTSCRAGINFPYLALKLLEGEKIDIPKPNFGFSEIMDEKPIIKTNTI